MLLLLASVCLGTGQTLRNQIDTCRKIKFSAAADYYSTAVVACGRP